MSNYTFTSPRAERAISLILAALGERPHSSSELQETLHMSQSTANRYLMHLTSAPRRIFISRWERTSGNLRPFYAIGNRKDAAKPRAFTKREHNVAQWKAIKGDRFRHEDAKRVANVSANIRRCRVAPQTWFGALVGLSRTTQKEAA